MNTLALACLVVTEKQVQDFLFFKQMFPDPEKAPKDACASYLVFSMMSSPGYKMANLYFNSRNECLSDAVQAYREHLYVGEYSGKPEKEQAYIAALLEQLAGNPLPLKDFYRALHQERKQKAEQKNLRLIKAQQEMNCKREKELATQKVQQATEIQQIRNNKSATINDENEICSDHTFNKPEKYIIIEPVIKKKTKGTAGVQSGKVETTSKKEEKGSNPIILSRKNYKVFQALVGESLDRNITLEDVKSLLGSGLKCTLTPGGNGIHQKAKAPKGGAWTMPREWGHPIPDYYRQQLNDFLQNTMEIDPSEVKLFS